MNYDILCVTYYNISEKYVKLGIKIIMHVVNSHLFLNQNSIQIMSLSEMKYVQEGCV